MSDTAFWRMGATPVPCTEIGRWAAEFEAAGWDGLAIGEAHGLLPDPYAALAVAATATRTLMLGTSVAVPLRHPLLAADAMATVHALSGGRSRFVIGRGDGAMKVLQRGPMPVAAFANYLRRLQGFLRREEVEIDGDVSSMSRVDDIDPSLAAGKPEVSVAATGPRMIAAAARWADAIDFSVGADPDRLRQCIATAREACDAVGRPPGTLALGCYLQVAVLEGEDEQADARAREAVRGLIVTHARFSGNFSGAAAASMAPVLSAVRGGVARTAGGKPGQLDFYPKDALEHAAVERFGVLGPVQHCAERLAEIAALGLAHIYIGTRSVGVDLEERNTLRVGREVLPLVRSLQPAAAR